MPLRGRGQPFQLTHARIGPFHNCRRIQFLAQHAHTHFAHRSRIQSLRQQLQNNEVAVLVDDQSRQLVRLAEAKPASIRLVGQHRLAPRNRGREAARPTASANCASAIASRDTSRSAICEDGLYSAVPSSNPRLSATGSSAGAALASVQRFHIRRVNPNMPRTQPIRRTPAYPRANAMLIRARLGPRWPFPGPFLWPGGRFVRRVGNSFEILRSGPFVRAAVCHDFGEKAPLASLPSAPSRSSQVPVVFALVICSLGLIAFTGSSLAAGGYCA